MKRLLLTIITIFSLVIITNRTEAVEMTALEIAPGINLLHNPHDNITIVYFDKNNALAMIDMHEGGGRIFGVAAVVSGVANNFLPLKGILSGVFGLASVGHAAYAAELRKKVTDRGLMIVRDKNGQRVLSR